MGVVKSLRSAEIDLPPSSLDGDGDRLARYEAKAPFTFVLARLARMAGRSPLSGGKIFAEAAAVGGPFDLNQLEEHVELLIQVALWFCHELNQAGAILLAGQSEIRPNVPLLDGNWVKPLALSMPAVDPALKASIAASHALL